MITNGLSNSHPAAHGRVGIEADPEPNPMSGRLQLSHSTPLQEQMQTRVDFAAVEAEAGAGLRPVPPPSQQLLPSALRPKKVPVCPGWFP